MKKNIGPKTRGFTSPVVLVGTTDKNGRKNLITLAWAGICCSEPPAIQISVRPGRYSHSSIVESGVFSVNMPSDKFLAETDCCGIASGRNSDKLELTGLTTVPGPVLGVPIVEEFPIAYECKLSHTLNVGSHDLFVGEVVSCLAEDRILGANNTIKASEGGLIAYMPEDGYYSLGERLALSFNVGKTLLPKK